MTEIEERYCCACGRPMKEWDRSCVILKTTRNSKQKGKPRTFQAHADCVDHALVAIRNEWEKQREKLNPAVIPTRTDRPPQARMQEYRTGYMEVGRIRTAEIVPRLGEVRRKSRKA